MIVNGSNKVDDKEQVVLLVICSEKPSNAILENRFFKFTLKDGEPWIYQNQDDWFFPVRIIVLNEIELTDENLSTYFPFVPFISDRAKFLEFFPKIQNLDIPEYWKFWCEVFASKTNPLYQEVERMDYHFLDFEDVKLLLSHTPKSFMPGVLEYVLTRTPPEEVSQTLDKIVRQLEPELRKEILEKLSREQEEK